MTLDQVIEQLQALREAIGPDALPVVDGMTGDRGIVKVYLETDDAGTEWERKYVVIEGDAGDMT